MDRQDKEFQETGYFMVSVYPADRSQSFGEVSGDRMYLNARGQIAYQGFPESMELRPGVEVEDYLLRPDSIHGIIVVSDCPELSECDKESRECIGRKTTCYALVPGEISKPSTRLIEFMVDHFKSETTRKISMAEGQEIAVEALWQLGYFEKPIRNRKELDLSMQFLRKGPSENVFTQVSSEQMAPKCKSCGQRIAKTG
ncbi:MAG: hypothetical protein R6V10_10645 [bacterium]